MSNPKRDNPNRERDSVIDEDEQSETARKGDKPSAASRDKDNERDGQRGGSRSGSSVTEQGGGSQGGRGGQTGSEDERGGSKRG